MRNPLLSSSFRSACALLVLAFVSARVSSAESELVADLGDGLALSVGEVFLDHSPMAKMGDVAFFFNDDGIHGRELWRTDGSESGTFLLRDLCPGACGTVPQADRRQIAALADQVVFLADDGVHGVEIGVTDGTSEGTSLLVDLRPGLFSSDPGTLLNAGARVFFTADDGIQGRELWTTDGTAAGTTAVTASLPGTMSWIACAIDLGGVLLFSPGSAEAPGLWRSDGTADGTYRISAVSTPQQNYTVWAPFLRLGDRLLFAGGPLDSFETTLWVSDGTAQGTHELAPIEDPYQFAGGESVAYFDENGLTRRLWRTDGTPEGTVIVPLPETLQLPNFSGRVVAPGDRLFFVGYDDDSGAEPWTTDGTTAFRLADVFPGSDSSMAVDQNFFTAFSGPFFAPLNGESVLFFADEGIHGRELWATNGTESGTSLSIDLNPGPPSTTLDFSQSLFPQTVLSGELLFRVRSLVDRSLYTSDGTSEGTTIVSVLDEQPSAFTVYNDESSGFFNPPIGSCFGPFGRGLFFAPQTIGLGMEPWTSDGAPGGTALVADLRPGLSWSIPFGCTSFRGRTLFVATVDDDLATTSGIWSYTAPGEPLELVHAGGTLGFWEPPTLGESLYFGSYEGLHATDGTSAGTSLVAFSDFSNSELSAAGGLLFIGAEQLLTNDGSSELEPVRPPEFGGPTSPFLFTPLGERELFLTRTDTETPLWVSDGTAPGTLDLTPAFGGATAPFEEDLLLGGTFAVPRFAVVDSRAFFAADDAVHGSELWMTDGTVAGTALVSDIVNGPYPSSPRELVRFGSHVYFVAESHGKGRELWRTDGTEAGTELVADLVKGAGSSLPENLYAAGSELYFSAWTPARGREAWRIRLDGSPSPQPVPLDEIAPGAFSSSPQIFREIGGTVFTVANDNLHGFELWTLREPDVVFADGFEGTTAALWSSAP